MKNVLAYCLFLFILMPAGVYSQVFYLNNGFTNGGQVKSCSGSFKSSNPGGSYNNFEKYSVTFNPEFAASQAIQIDFDTLDIAVGDTLFFYDGTSVSAPLLTYLTNRDGVPFSVRATASNGSGALTVLFKSDSSLVGKGWNGILNCKSPCQQIGVNVITQPAADANGFVNICKGGTVTFSGAGTYNQNDIYYHQSDTTAKYIWTFSDGKDTSGIFAHQIKRTFNTEQGTIVQLALMDQNECYNLSSTRIKVRTSLTPTFNIPEKSICVFDTLSLTAKPSYPLAVFSNLPVYSDNKPLNDGVGKCYETSINVTEFSPQQKLTNINDLSGILINMEHSWLGDITIAITAPNGIKVYLKKSVGTTPGWETFLGEPVDEPSLNSPLSSVPGKGYDYLFSPNPKYGSMLQEKGKYNYSYTDNAGQNQVNHTYLPAGSYASEDSLKALLGTPLNGLWTIEVCDNFKEDNGFIFYWTIKFKPSVYPNTEVYSGKATMQVWQPAAGLLSTKDSVATITHTNAGNYSYKYSLTDQFGCTVDTTVKVNVNGLPAKPNLGPDTTICLGKTVTVSVVNAAAANTYSWSTGAANVTSQAITKAGIYTVQAANSFGCSIKDTIKITDNEPISISLGKDTLFCSSSPNQLTPVYTGNISSFVWSTGATTAAITLTKPGTYIVTGKTNSGCQINDTVLVAGNPADLLKLPADTSLCTGSSYQLTLTGTSGIDIKWDDGITGPSHKITEGKYSITNTYKGCTATDEMIVTSKPIPVVNLGADTSICIGFDLPLRVNYPAADYLWSTGSKQNNITAINAGLYWVQSNLNGCTFRDSLVMTQRRCECVVKMPNAFSPNGDGINDVYNPEISCFPKDYRLSVFNRYGQLIFSSTDYQTKWNGTMKGNPLPVGTYYYILSYFNVDLQKSEQYKGSITLLR